ncbi:MAG TPA: magnesium transporter [Gammaproteobacteria bacterium]|nr:magnesium transporter [Gammaproteobacteria bacterium]
MPENSAEQLISEQQAFSKALHDHAYGKALQLLNDMNSAEVAHLLESLPADERDLAWDLVRTKLEGDVLIHVNDNLRASLIRKMEPHELVAATSGLETDDLADLLPDMPDEVFNKVLLSMDEQNRLRLESALSYPENSAGGLMNMDTITVRADITVDVLLRYLRRHKELPEHTDTLMVVDREGKFMGVVPLTTLLTSVPTATVAEIMQRDVEAIPADMPAHEVAKLFELHDLVSAPVVDDKGLLLGRITVDDVVDIIRDEGEHSLMSMAGLHEEEDLFAPVVPSARRRALWLGINLLTAFLASWVIGLFDGTIQKLVALAVLMPIVASMGGIAGSQTMTLVIRGLALDQISDHNARKLLFKEVAVGMINSMMWALVVAAMAWFWFDNPELGAVIAAAMTINLLIAAVAGVTIPLLLRKLGADPALAGGVVLTTVTDVVGFLSFLGLATLFLV